MKLFREYFAGHISHQFHLFGEDDIKFLRQFDMKYWNMAMEQRYCADLPKALLAREQKRSEPLEGFKDENGNRVTMPYYEYIESRANQIFDNLSYKGGENRDGTPDNNRTRIKKATYNNAKNTVDSLLSQRPDEGGKWMIVELPKTTYEFFFRAGPKKQRHEVQIRNNYIKELVNRLEGGKIIVDIDGQRTEIPARGGSAKGYDLSKLENFDSDVEDYEQKGGWKTLGFTCPAHKEIMQNVQNWLAYHEEGLLDDPEIHDTEEEKDQYIINRELHRSRSRQEYTGNQAKEASDFSLTKNIYRNPLISHYRNILQAMIEEYKKTGNITANQVQIIQNQFIKNSIDDDSLGYFGRPAYSLVKRGEFKKALQEFLRIKDLGRIDASKCKKLIKELAEGNAYLLRIVAEGFADIDLAHFGAKTFRGRYFDVEGRGNKLTLSIDENPENPNITIPEVKKGKIIFHIPTIRRKLKDKRDRVFNALREPMQDNLEGVERVREVNRRNKLNDELEELTNEIQSFENLVRSQSVGYHYDALDLANRAKRREKIFLQFDDENDIPPYIDLRDRNLGGGLSPNQNMPDAVGPSKKNVVNAIHNLQPYVVNKNRMKLVIQNYIRAANNRDSDFAIVYATFADNQANSKTEFYDEEGNQITDQKRLKKLKDLAEKVYNDFTDLIIDQCLRNIGDFDIPQEEREGQGNLEKAVVKSINKIISSTTKRILEKDLGPDIATARKRTSGGEANLVDVSREIKAMKGKTA